MKTKKIFTPVDPYTPLSGWDPIHFGIDTFGENIQLKLVGRNMLIGGEQGAGKSVSLNLIAAHNSLCPDVRQFLFDPKMVEFGLWKNAADAYVTNDLVHTLAVLTYLQQELERRYIALDMVGRRIMTAEDNTPILMVMLDEFTYYSKHIGGPDAAKSRKHIIALILDLVARGRAVGIIVVIASQRPSTEILPGDLRDLFAYRLGFRCTNAASSDIVLGQHFASDGIDSSTIDFEALGQGYLFSEENRPRKIKTAFLSPQHVKHLAHIATVIRSHSANQHLDQAAALDTPTHELEIAA